MQHDVRQALSTWTGGLVEAPPAPVAPVAPATHEVEAPVPARDALQQSQPEPLVPSPDEPPSQEALDPAMSSSAAIEAPPPAAMLPSPVPVGAGVPAETAAPAVPAGTTDVVNMEFSADCWVEIRDANNQLLVSEIKRAGQALALTGKPPLSVHLGNADGVALRWQGQPVTLTPDAGTRTARLVLGN